MNEDGIDRDLLIDGDDDLLDYFLGNDGGELMGDLLDGEPLPALDQVRNGMETLLSQSNSTQQDPLAGFDTAMEAAFEGSGNMFNLGPSNEQISFPDAPLGSTNMGMKPSNGLFYDSQTQDAPLYNNNAGNQTWTDHAKKETQAAMKPRRETSKTKSRAANSRGTQSLVKVEPNTSPLTQTTGGGNEDTEEKRLRRLARNRESARQSRRRKKEHLELLEERVSQLTAELDVLRRKYLENANAAIHARRQNMFTELQANLDDPNLRQKLANILVETGPSSKDRAAILETQYKHILDLLLPPHTKFMLWMMNQNDSFFEENFVDPVTGQTTESGLWALVSSELNLTSDQQEKLRANFRHNDSSSSREERQRLHLCVSLIEKLRSNVVTRAKTVETHMRAILDILSPEQALNYVLWVEQNRDTLDECGVGEAMIFGALESHSQGNERADSAKKNAVQQILLKPESETTLHDLEVLLDVLNV